MKGEVIRSTTKLTSARTKFGDEARDELVESYRNKKSVGGVCNREVWTKIAQILIKQVDPYISLQ